MWNIDSLDWADPIPESIAMRVLHELAQKQKGIILFHDIHKQSVLALTPVIESCMRRNTHSSFDSTRASVSTPPSRLEYARSTPRRTAPHGKPRRAQSRIARAGP